jgi:hypothetical protein
MATLLPVTQCLQDAKRVSEDGRDPVQYLQCLVKYWEYEHQCAPTGWARRYSMRMRRGAIAALRQIQSDHVLTTPSPYTDKPILETNHERIF